VNIIKRASKSRCAMIAQNAGVEGSIVVQKIKDTTNIAFGYNAAIDEYGDLWQGASSTRPRSAAPRCRTRRPLRR
jgi:chaperonin GroEL